MSDIEKKLDNLLIEVSGIKPVLLDVRENQKAMDVRMRVSEARGEQHEVKIIRIQEDLDGLGRRVRAIPVAPKPGSNWSGIVEFLAVLPAYWHVFTAFLFFAGSIAVAAWKH